MQDIRSGKPDGRQLRLIDAAAIGRRALSGVGVLAVLALLAAVLIPIAMIVLTSFSTKPLGAGGNWTISNYTRVITDPTGRSLLFNTFVYAFSAAVIAVGLATLFAWTVTRTSVPARRVLRVLPLLTLAAPPLMKDIAWIQLYSPTSGLANLVVNHFFHVGHLFNIYSMEGLIILTAVYAVPLPYLILLQPIASLDPRFEEASFVAGVSRLKTQFTVTLRILAPAFLSAFALTLILIAGTFEAPLLVGLPAGVQTYMAVIYRSLNTAPPNFPLASAQAAWYLILTFLIFWAYIRATRREKNFVTIGGRSERRPADVSWLLRFVLVFLLVVYFVFAFAIPIILSGLLLFIPIYELQAANLIAAWNLEIIHGVLSKESHQLAITGSLKLALAVSVLTVVVGSVLSFVALKTRLYGRRLVEIVATLPIAIPGMIFSVTILVTVITIGPLSRYYNTIWPVVFALVFNALPFTVRVLSSALIQVDGDLLSASAVSGARTVRTITRILIPLIGSAIVNAMIVAFIVSFRELGAVVLIVPTDQYFVPSLVWQYWGEGLLQEVNALNAVMLVVPLVVGLCAWGGLAAVRLVGRYLDTRRWGTGVPDVDSPIQEAKGSAS